MHAVGEQRRSQRVAGIAAIGGAVEAEIQLLAAIDQAAGGEAERLGAHAAAPALRAFAISTAVIAWLRVSRVTTSQAWQPAP